MDRSAPLHPDTATARRPAVATAGLLLFVVVGFAFALWPQLDLAVSGAFARGTDGFPLQHDALLGAVNGAVLAASRIGAALLAGLALLSLLPGARNPLARARPALLLLAATALLGPGLLVNGLLKEHVGRARPVQVERFGGTRHFTAAFAPADECDTNCSFVSGHVAGAALPVAGYFIAGTRRRRRLWLAGGLAFAAAVGLARIAVGAHFLSDVVLAVGFTWLALVVADALLRTMPLHRAREAARTQPMG